MRLPWVAIAIACTSCTGRVGFQQPSEPDPAPDNCGPLTLPVASDTTAPTVTVTSPLPDETVTGTLSVRTTAADNVYLSGVRLWIDEAQLGARDHRPPYGHDFDTTTLRNGRHRLTARAEDAAGNQHTSTVDFLVANGDPAGAIYYACGCDDGADPDCVAGNDGNPGTDPSAPIETVGRVRALDDSLACGDAFLYCRGGSIAQGSSTHPPSRDCPPDNPIVFGAYWPDWASGDESRPQIVVTASTHGFYVAGPNPRRGFVFEDLHFRCTGCSENAGQSAVFFHFAGADDNVVRRCEIEGFPWGIHQSGNTNITVEYSFLHHNRTVAGLGAGAGAVYRYNQLTDNGCIGAASDLDCQNSGHLALGFNGNGESPRVIGNELTRTGVDSVGRCRGIAITANNGGNGTVIADNYFHEAPGTIHASCAAFQSIAIPNTTPNEGCTNCVISGNRVENLGSGFAIASHQGTVISNNTVSLVASDEPRPRARQHPDHQQYVLHGTRRAVHRHLDGERRHRTRHRQQCRSVRRRRTRVLLLLPTRGLGHHRAHRPQRVRSRSVDRRRWHRLAALRVAAGVGTRHPLHQRHTGAPRPGPSDLRHDSARLRERARRRRGAELLPRARAGRRPTRRL